jgi:hypothetical protein
MKWNPKNVELKTNVLVQRTPPSTAVKKWSFYGIFFARSEVAVLRQSNSHRRMGTERSPCEVESNTASVKRWGKNISQR